MANISYKLSGTYPPYGVELRQNNITGAVLQDVVVESNGMYQFSGVTFGDYVIVVYDTVGGITCSDVINVSLTTTTTTTTTAAPTTTTTTTTTSTTTTTTTTTTLQVIGVVAVGLEGSDSAIGYSSNGGASYSKEIIAGGFFLEGADFFDQNVGIAVGGSGTVLRTTDGGASWTQIGSNISPVHPDATNTIRSIRAGTSNTLFFAGNGSNVFKTTDKGLTWTKGGTYNGLIRSIFAFNGQKVVLGGSVGIGQDRLLLSTNGGATFNVQLNFGTDSMADFRSIDFNSVGKGFGVGLNETFYESTNFADTWTKKSGTITIGGDSNLRKVRFVTDNILYLMGEFNSGNPMLYKSSNGGTTFTNLSAAVNAARLGVAPLRSGDWKDENNGWIAFTDGEILVTNNGGVSWTSVSIPAFTGTIFSLTYVPDSPVTPII